LGFSGFFRSSRMNWRVAALRQGVREVQPGLNYHLPYPIETAFTLGAAREQDRYRHACS
jgi:membrane protease subunit HflK